METDAESICRLACRAGLWSDAEASSLLRRFRARFHGVPELSGDLFVEFLVKNRCVTRYQASCLLQGGRGLRLAGHFLISSPRGEPESWGRRWDGIEPGSSQLVVLHAFKPGFRDVARAWLTERTVAHSGFAKILGVLAEDIPINRQSTIVVEEFPPGMALSRLLRTSERLPVDRACSIALDIAHSLVELHRRGVGHGRIRPEEVLVQDSGRAVMLQGSLSGGVVGLLEPGESGDTAPARIPKLLVDSPGDDIRALGSLLHMMIAGLGAIAGSSSTQLGNPALEAAVARLEDSTETPPKLGELIRCMMAVGPVGPAIDAVTVARELLAFMPPGWRPSPRMPSPSEDAFRLSTSALFSSAPFDFNQGAVGMTESEVSEGQGRHGGILVSSEQARKETSAPVAMTSMPVSRADSVGFGASREAKRRPGESQAAMGDRFLTRSAAFRRPLWIFVLGMLAVAGFTVYRWSHPLSRAARLESSRNVRLVETAEPTRPRASVDADAVRPSNPAPPPNRALNELWQSPTNGHAVTFLRIPDGAQGMLWLRPAAILAEPEARSTLESLGPEVNDRLRTLLGSLELGSEEVLELLVAFTPRDAEPPEMCLNLRITAAAYEKTRTLIKNAAVNQRGLQGNIGDWGVWYPDDAKQWLIAAPDATLKQLIEEDRSPVLRRQLEALRRMSDDQWLLACFFTPNFLAADGESLWMGGLRRLREPILRFCGDTAQAVGAGCFVGNGVLFLEARLVYSGTESVAAKVLETPGRLDGLLAAAKQSLAQSGSAGFWKPLADRFPAMLEAARQWTRVGSDEAGLVINMALPSVAARNLFLATELALLDSPSSESADGTEAAAGKSGRGDVATVLELPISLVVRQQSLEAVIQEIASAVRDKHGLERFEIDVRGQDLQLDGITRNQQLRGVQLQDRPLREVLTEVVRRANPQKVESVTMAEQKLVWVVASVGEATTESKVVITTRDAAAKNGWKLPSEFLD